MCFCLFDSDSEVLVTWRLSLRQLPTIHSERSGRTLHSTTTSIQVLNSFFFTSGDFGVSAARSHTLAGKSAGPTTTMTVMPTTTEAPELQSQHNFTSSTSMSQTTHFCHNEALLYCMYSFFFFILPVSDEKWLFFTVLAFFVLKDFWAQTTVL